MLRHTRSKMEWLFCWTVLMLGISCVMGQTQYDASTQLCCGKTVYPNSDGLLACCEDSITYTSNTQQCCGFGVQPLKNAEGVNLVCCGNKTYTEDVNKACDEGYKWINIKDLPMGVNNEDQMCCGGICKKDPSFQLQGRFSLGCCTEKFVDLTKEICCDDNIVVPIPAGYNENTFLCCSHGKGYRKDKEICCFDTGDILQLPANSDCEAYEYSCCGGNLIGPEKRCYQGVAYNSPIIYPPYKVEYPVGLQGPDYSYDTGEFCEGGGYVQDRAKDKCCGSEKALSSAPQIGFWCCGKFGYDPKTQICCEDKVYNVHPESFVGCCGNQIYNYATQLCCGVKIIETTDKNAKCCDGNKEIYRDEIRRAWINGVKSPPVWGTG